MFLRSLKLLFLTVVFTSSVEAQTAIFGTATPTPTPNAAPKSTPTPGATPKSSPTPTPAPQHTGYLHDISIGVVCNYALSADPLCGSKPTQVSWYGSYDEFPSNANIRRPIEASQNFTAVASTSLDPRPEHRSYIGGIIYRERICLPDSESFDQRLAYEHAAVVYVKSVIALAHSVGALNWTCPAAPYSDGVPAHASAPEIMPYTRPGAGPEARPLLYFGPMLCSRVVGETFRNDIRLVSPRGYPDCTP